MQHLVEPLAISPSHPNANAGFGGWESACPLKNFVCAMSNYVGVPFVAVEKASGRVLARSDSEALFVLPDNSVAAISSLTSPDVWEYESGLLLGAVEVPSFAGVSAVAVGWMLSRPEAHPSELVLAAAAEGWSQQRLDAYLASQQFCSHRVFSLFLRNAVTRIEHERRDVEMQHEIVQLGNELESTYEEITLLHSLARNLHVSRSPAEIAEICLDGIQGRMACEGTAMWIQPKEQPPTFASRGNLPFDRDQLPKLLSKLSHDDWSRPYVKNHISRTSLAAEYPGLQSLVVVPIGAAPEIDGWIVSWNMNNGCEFGTVEASLLNSIATIFGTHLRNIDLFRQNADLLLSFVRSLVSTLDAKDPYTRGHSERVALIARRIGEVMHLSHDDLKDIYLAGLLHDIGKIGVDDSILRKPGSLTNEEFSEIQKHPDVGFSILKGLKNLQAVLPGVRNHHESYNGTGYPDKLKGDDIPLIARILAVADSYDAMGSDRPYRKGMPTETIHDIFRRGAGKQWDTKVVDAYFEIADDIAKLCADYSPSDITGLVSSAYSGSTPA